MALSLSTPEADHVLVEKRSPARILILNRPRQLNALRHSTVTRLLDLFLAYEKDPRVKLIVMKGNGRAFCAGGDVPSVVGDMNKGNWRSGANFYRKQLTLDYVIATYSKPQVSLLNGIVMGGGAGLAIHGRFRVATENSVFSMPETALGLFPDVGASYFLSRLPGFFGEYIGLTGSRLDGAEMLAYGLATHFVPSERLLRLEEALCKANSSDPATVSAIISKFSEAPNLKRNSGYYRFNIINSCFSQRTIEDIIAALEIEAVSNKDDWISSTIQSLKQASPTSLKIFLRSIREGRYQGLDKCLFREYRMVCHAMKGDMSKDLSEGCRAILWDKDRNPKWQPSKLELVSDEMVNCYFSKLNEEDWEDLELPFRSNLPPHAMAKL